MKKNNLFKILLIFSVVLTFSTSLLAKDPGKLLVNGKDWGYTVFSKNGLSYVKATDFSDMFSTEPPRATDKTITYIKQIVPNETLELEIELRDNSISWNGKKTGAYAIKSSGDFYLPIRSVTKYLQYSTVWLPETGDVNLLAYHTEGLKNKTVDVFGFSLPIRLFDDETIRLDEPDLPYLTYGYLEGLGYEYLNAHVYVTDSTKLQNLLTLMFNSEFAGQIIQSLNNTSDLIKVPLENELVMEHSVTSDGLYTLSIQKRSTR